MSERIICWCSSRVSHGLRLDGVRTLKVKPNVRSSIRNGFLFAETSGTTMIRSIGILGLPTMRFSESVGFLFGSKFGY